MTYRSREAPVPGSSVSETHPGFWADHIKKEQLIEHKWYKDYGHLYYEKDDNSSAPEKGLEQRQTHGHGAAEHPAHRQVHPNEPVAYLKSRIEGAQSDATGSRGASNIRSTIKCAESKVTPPTGYKSACSDACSPLCGGRFAPSQQGKPREELYKAYDYSTPGNVQKHIVVRDPVTSYSESFGHHSYQYNRQKPASGGVIKTGISRTEYNMPNEKYLCHVNSHCPKHHSECDKYCSSASHPDVVACTSKFRDLTLSAQKSACNSLVDPSGGSKSNGSFNQLSDPECCPKCRRMLCVCVPRRREKVPEKRGTTPSEELPPWPPQPWLGPTYTGSRRITEGDILRLRYRLSRDPQSKTPATRMYEEMKRVNFYDGKPVHSGPNSLECPVCRSACKAERGTYFQEQLRKGNPFTTGDTQFRSCSYSTRVNDRDI